MSLEWSTNKELIDELTNRETFIGFICYSEKGTNNESPKKGQNIANFKVETTISHQDTKLLVNKISESLPEG